MKNKEKRIDALKELLQRENSMKISDISDRLGVSSMTIRRDIDILAKNDILKVLHGVVVYSSGDTGTGLSDYMLTEAESENIEKKKALGRYAATLIEENDIIFIDAGSTTEAFAQFLPKDIHFTVLCYAINIFLAVATHKNVDVILCGGFYNRKTTILEQTKTPDLLMENRTRKAFLSAGGVHWKLGVMCANQSECHIKRAALSSTAQSYLLIDSTKFGHIHSCFFSQEKDFDHIITNSDIPQDYKNYLKEQEIDVHYV
ncbi:MAG: DeoR/GlpR transcriptional regulator [Spirochaetales bacterium]|nr:DeoR/GlpR transcriptional regulator [Spirochaetales bacterium]